MLQLPAQQPALFSTPQKGAQLLHLQAQLKTKMPREKTPSAVQTLSPSSFLLPAHDTLKKGLEVGGGENELFKVRSIRKDTEGIPEQ